MIVIVIGLTSVDARDSQPRGLTRMKVLASLVPILPLPVRHRARPAGVKKIVDRFDFRASPERGRKVCFATK
jgi:hypothetical protein